MWRSKKFMVGAILAVALLAGSLGGIALADDNGDGGNTLLDKVTKILVGKGVDITSAQLQDAFTQARAELHDAALDSYLSKLVNDGTITQEQADQYKAWLQSRPDSTQYRQQLRDWQLARPGIPPEFNDWQQNRPDVPIPGGFGRFGGHGGFQGMGGMRGFGGLRLPIQ